MHFRSYGSYFNIRTRSNKYSRLYPGMFFGPPGHLNRRNPIHSNARYLDLKSFKYTSWYCILPPGLRSLARPPHLNVVTVQHAATLYKNIPPQFLSLLSLLSLQQFLVIDVSNHDSEGMWFCRSDVRSFKSSAWFSRGHNFPYMCLPHFLKPSKT